MVASERKAKFKHVKLPVHFNSVSIAVDTASVKIGVKLEDMVPKGEETGDKAKDEDAAVVWAARSLRMRQLGGKIIVGRRDEGETQGKLHETDFVINGTFDTGSISIGSKSVGVTLSMAKSETDINVLSSFAASDGFFLITSLMDQIDVEKMEADKAAENDAERDLLKGEDADESDDHEAETNGGGTATATKKKGRKAK
jgi:hypothetical protein